MKTKTFLKLWSLAGVLIFTSLFSLNASADDERPFPYELVIEEPCLDFYGCIGDDLSEGPVTVYATWPILQISVFANYAESIPNELLDELDGDTVLKGPDLRLFVRDNVKGKFYELLVTDPAIKVLTGNDGLNDKTMWRYRFRFPMASFPNDSNTLYAVYDDGDARIVDTIPLRLNRFVPDYDPTQPQR